MSPELKPVEGKIVLKFLDEETEGEKRDRMSGNMQPGSTSEKGVFAQVIAVGPKSVAKKGAVVIVRPWARDGLDLGDDTVLTDDYCVMASVAQ